MNKKVLMWFFAGWLLALVVSPTVLLGVFKSKS